MKKHLCRSASLVAVTLLTACGVATLEQAKSNQQTGPVLPPSATQGPLPGPVGGPALATATQLTTSNGGPYFMGRFDMSDPNGPMFAWSGSSIYATFTGTGINITLNELNQPATYTTASGTLTEGNMYDVTVDGNAYGVLGPQYGSGSYVLASGLSYGSHNVVVTKRTEADVGTAQFEGFTVDGNPLAAPATLALDRRIEVLGDSISCGYGVLGASAACTFSPLTEDESIAYGFVAANSLQAEVHVAAWSGKGVYRNNDGTTTSTLPDLYPLTLPADPNSTWDFNQWVPQVVVINLGTNDFATGIPYAPSFEGAYDTLLTTIRGNYPNALIFCALGPMLSDTYPADGNYLSTARTYIQTVVQNSMDPNIFFIEFPMQGSDVGCDSHPDPATQAAMGAQLAQAIAAKTGWNEQ